MNNSENIYPAILKRLRGIKSQAELARLCGIPQSNYTRYEAGTVKPKHDALCKIAMHFGLTVDEMLANSEPKQAANPDTHSRETMIKCFEIAYDALIKSPHGQEYVSWLASALSDCVDSVDAFRSGNQDLGRSKAYRAHTVLGHIFRDAEKKGP